MGRQALQFLKKIILFMTAKSRKIISCASNTLTICSMKGNKASPFDRFGKLVVYLHLQNQVQDVVCPCGRRIVCINPYAVVINLQNKPAV